MPIQTLINLLGEKVMEDWICTDPDTGQYGRQLDKFKFEFREKFEQKIIDLEVYAQAPADYIELILNRYGYTLMPDGIRGNMNVYDQYGDHASWIIAECIFEEQSGMY